MVNFDGRLEAPVGTPAYDNWRAFNNHGPWLAEFEHPLYTDARLTGQVTSGLGPYAFINLVPLFEDQHRARAAFVLRWSDHVFIELPKTFKTDAKRYHGGNLTEELAALASLRCGVRLRSGGVSRRFEPKGDPKGTPVAWHTRAAPSFDLGNGRLILPTVAGEHSIMPIVEMSSFPLLKPEQAIALVRSARLYQDALWLAESEPNLCWLMLVGAAETAANCWRAEKDSALDRLTFSDPDFVNYLRKMGGEELASHVAAKFADSLGVTKKFVEFLVRFLPGPPELRPDQWVQVEWTTENLTTAFKKIYSHRSKALHDGMPFPAPLCSPPARYDPSWSTVAERPGMVAASQQGGTWQSNELPMHLHVFEYVVRNAINAWWSSLKDE